MGKLLFPPPSSLHFNFGSSHHWALIDKHRKSLRNQSRPLVIAMLHCFMTIRLSQTKKGNKNGSKCSIDRGCGGEGNENAFYDTQRIFLTVRICIIPLHHRYRYNLTRIHNSYVVHEQNLLMNNIEILHKCT